MKEEGTWRRRVHVGGGYVEEVGTCRRRVHVGGVYM